MNWLSALKEWNASHGGRYTIPRKGTAEYSEVRKLMTGGAMTKAGKPSHQPSGYVKLLYAKLINKKKYTDYPADKKPTPRPKKSAKKFDYNKINVPSEFLRSRGAVGAEERALAEEMTAAKKSLPKAKAGEDADTAAEEKVTKKAIAKELKSAAASLAKPKTKPATIPKGPNVLQQVLVPTAPPVPKKAQAAALALPRASEAERKRQAERYEAERVKQREKDAESLKYYVEKPKLSEAERLDAYDRTDLLLYSKMIDAVPARFKDGYAKWASLGRPSRPALAAERRTELKDATEAALRRGEEPPKTWMDLKYKTGGAYGAGRGCCCCCVCGANSSDMEEDCD